jgi:hypothetical protein
MRPWTTARQASVALQALGVAIVLAGCGGGSSDDEGVPQELVGTYETTIAESDKDGGEDWAELGLEYRLRIAPSGGPDDGPALTLDNADSAFGTLESTSLRVDGDRLKLLNQICESRAESDVEFFDNEYSYVLEGSTLTITTVENQCENEVAMTILTTNPWEKTSDESEPLPLP